MALSRLNLYLAQKAQEEALEVYELASSPRGAIYKITEREDKTQVCVKEFSPRAVGGKEEWRLHLALSSLKDAEKYIIRTIHPYVVRANSDSPRHNSPRSDTFKLDSPRRDSPRHDSPRLDSPRLDSPRCDTPRRNSPRSSGLKPSHFSFAMEYAPNGTLATWIGDNSKSMDVATQYRFMEQAVDCIRWLHETANCMHGDVKPLNYVIDGEFNLKLCDFGTTKTLGKPVAKENTPHYTAPEIFRGTDQNPALATKEADVYSLAILLWEMIAQETPYGDINRFAIMLGVMNNGLRPKMDENTFPPKVAKLITWGWSAVPADRPSAAAMKDEMANIRNEREAAELVNNFPKLSMS